MLGAVQYIMRAIQPGAGAQGRGIGTRSRFGQTIAAEKLAAAQARQDVGALACVAELVDHAGDHVVNGDVGGSAGAAARELLHDHHAVQAGKAGAARIFPHENAAHAERRRLPHHIDGEMMRLIPGHGMGRDFACGEIAGHVLNGGLVWR